MKDYLISISTEEEVSTTAAQLAERMAKRAGYDKALAGNRSKRDAGKFASDGRATARFEAKGG